MIPDIRTKKTFPGCIRSFKGFPLYDDEDISALQYIACTALKLRSKIPPWNKLPHLKKGKNIEQNSPKKPVLWMVEFFLF